MQKKGFDIPKKLIWKAYKKCKNTKVVGIDGQSMRDFKVNRSKRIHELWKELSSGEYVPSPVLRIYKRKKHGGWRPLGITTVRDHLVQQLVRDHLFSAFKEQWHPNSFFHLKGKKGGKRATLAPTRDRWLSYDWTLIVDIKEYAENIDHQTLIGMLRKHFDNPWVLLYTERLLKAPAQLNDGTLVRGNKGISQGNSLSYFLVDFYLHYIFDQWMEKNHPKIVFERYLDDIYIHCHSEAQAQNLLSQISERFTQYKLKINKKKTKIVYGQDGL
ncbi:reverse transcriptase domain-containing protein [Bacillus sp. EB01]|uniref:reverse transcriptase domain-containing protein n=1 Tax=Bacillus sp. EB01 TaxID=1347086 RepID=UPI0006940A07|nr:reverse transcriptase domain-containing protein [Bacillus sp. EB01]